MLDILVKGLFDRVVGILVNFLLRFYDFLRKGRGVGIFIVIRFDCIFLCFSNLKRMLNVSVRFEYLIICESNNDCSLYLYSSFYLRSLDIILLFLKILFGGRLSGSYIFIFYF